MMANEKFTTLMDYLTTSVENNEVTNIERLTLAIDELENFPMTFDILDNSRVGQILQSVRHSKEMTVFISERIRSLIKCWRQLLNPEIFSVIPNNLKCNMGKTPAVKNGYTNGYVKDLQIPQSDAPINGIVHSTSKEEEPVDVNLKRSSPAETEKETNTCNLMEIRSVSSEEPTRVRNISNSSKNDSQNLPNVQVCKPKVKSTKELLADFSNFIENDTKNKILMDKISQEADEPISYFPQDFKMKELVQMSIFQEAKYKNKLRSDASTLKRKRPESVCSYESQDAVPLTSKCEMFISQFKGMCTHRPQVILKQIVPWTNLKRGLRLTPPEIKQSLSHRKRQKSSTTPPEPENPLSLDVINNLLESFEVRAQQKQMISEAIQQRKEQTTVIDNTTSLLDMSLKLKLKIPKIPPIKIRRKKRRKKKKKPKPIKVKVKKPRKPYVRPMPPITNYLDDIPSLPPLPSDVDFMTWSVIASPRPIMDNSAETVKKLAYGILEGYNCTKHSQNSQIFPLTEMYSNIIDDQYLHIFPWIDLHYVIRSTFPSDSNDQLHSIDDIPDYFS